MKILITGGSGQLGQSLKTVLPSLGHITAAPTHGEMDITDRTAVYDCIMRFQPQVVIHCAAYNKVDLAEAEQKRCFAVNVSGTENLALACHAAAARMIFISTDYVFDGRKDVPYLPEDLRAPLSVYGLSKMHGEDITLAAAACNAVIRTSWLFGPSRNNFVQAILHAAENRQEVDVVCDQFGSPTYSLDLAHMLCAFVETSASGIFHGVNAGICSRADYAREILRLAGIDCAVCGVSAAVYPSAAKRPENSALSTACLAGIGLAPLPPWQDALRRYMESVLRAEKEDV